MRYLKRILFAVVLLALAVSQVSAFDSISIFAHGAKCDGINNDTLSIQSAFNTASESGIRLVELPRGVCLVSIQANGRALTIPVNVELLGQGMNATILRLMPTVRSYSTLFGQDISNNIGDFDLHDLTIDLNNSANPVQSLADFGYALENGVTTFSQIRAAVKINRASDVTITRVRFTDADSINVLVLNGEELGDVSITDSAFTAIGESVVAHDHSTIYWHSNAAASITDNSFEGVPGGKGATTAIETHGSRQIVSRNRVENFQKGANITGVSDQSEGIIVTDNMMDNVRFGVMLWSYDNGLHQALIADNIINLAPDLWANVQLAGGYASGIAVTLTAPMTDLTVARNTITLKPVTYIGTTGVDFLAAGIQFYAVGINNKRWQIVDNVIDGAMVMGIYVSTNVDGLTLSRNMIYNVGQVAGVTTGYKVGILLSGTIRMFQIANNIVIDDRAPVQSSYGIYAAGTYSYGLVLDNLSYGMAALSFPASASVVVRQ